MQDWPVLEQGTEPIERRVAGRTVPPITGTWLLTRSDFGGEDDARQEAGLAFSLCGLVAIVQFSLLIPSHDTAGGSFGDFLVNGTTKPTAWNREQALASIRRVRLEGPLPAARISAAARGRTVAGKVLDCRRGPVAGATVLLERRAGSNWKRVATGRTSATGAYSLRARGAGLYRVSSGARRSAAIRVRG